MRDDDDKPVAKLSSDIDKEKAKEEPDSSSTTNANIVDPPIISNGDASKKDIQCAASTISNADTSEEVSSSSSAATTGVTTTTADESATAATSATEVSSSATTTGVTTTTADESATAASSATEVSSSAATDEPISATETLKKSPSLASMSDDEGSCSHMSEGKILVRWGLDSRTEFEGVFDKYGTTRIPLLTSSSTEKQPFDGFIQKDGIQVQLYGDVKYDSLQFTVNFNWKAKELCFVSFFANAKVEVKTDSGTCHILTKPVWITAMRGSATFTTSKDCERVAAPIRQAVVSKEATMTYSIVVHGFYCENITVSREGRAEELSNFRGFGRLVVFISDIVCLHLSIWMNYLGTEFVIETGSLYDYEFVQFLQLLHGIPLNVAYMSNALKTHINIHLWERQAYYLARSIRDGSGGPHNDSFLALDSYQRYSDENIDHCTSVYERCVGHELNDVDICNLTTAEIKALYEGLPSIDAENLDAVDTTVGRFTEKNIFMEQLRIEFFSFHSTAYIDSSSIIGTLIDRPTGREHDQRTFLYLHPAARVSSNGRHYLYSCQVDQLTHMTSLDEPKVIMKPVSMFANVGFGVAENYFRYVHVEFDDFVCFPLNYGGGNEPRGEEKDILPRDSAGWPMGGNGTSGVLRRDNRIVVRRQFVNEEAAEEFYLDMELFRFNARNAEGNPVTLGSEVEDALEKCNVQRRGFITFLLFLYGIGPTAVNTFIAVRDAIKLATTLKISWMVNNLELELVKVLNEMNFANIDALTNEDGLQFLMENNLRVVASYLFNTHGETLRPVLAAETVGFKEWANVG